jgi:hypothetical protein
MHEDLGVNIWVNPAEDINGNGVSIIFRFHWAGTLIILTIWSLIINSILSIATLPYSHHGEFGCLSAMCGVCTASRKAGFKRRARV